MPMAIVKHDVIEDEQVMRVGVLISPLALGEAGCIHLLSVRHHDADHAFIMKCEELRLK